MYGMVLGPLCWLRGGARPLAEVRTERKYSCATGRVSGPTEFKSSTRAMDRLSTDTGNLSGLKDDHYHRRQSREM